MILKIKKSNNLNGKINLPSSKAHTFRALILAGLAKGISIVDNPKTGNDWNLAVSAMEQYGAEISLIKDNLWKIKGTKGKLKTPSDIIYVGNSGTMLFFLLGIASSCHGWSIITGDHSIRNFRKISNNLIKPFLKLGVKIISTKEDGMAPFIIKGPISKKRTIIDGSGCQPVFSLLLAGALSKKPVEIKVSNPGETAYIELLLKWFDKTGIKYTNKDNQFREVFFPGNQIVKPFNATIPNDWSCVSYPLLAAIITKNSKLSVKNLDFTDPYGDKNVVNILKNMGAKIDIKGDTITTSSSMLYGINVDMNKLPDQVPAIAVAACFAKGKTVIKNVEIARFKECDRLSATAQELSKMGAKIMERKDGLVINQDGSWKLKPGNFYGYKDHRMVLSLSLAGLTIDEGITISDAEMIEKTFPEYVSQMTASGAYISLEEKI